MRPAAHDPEPQHQHCQWHYIRAILVLSSASIRLALSRASISALVGTIIRYHRPAHISPKEGADARAENLTLTECTYASPAAPASARASDRGQSGCRSVTGNATIEPRISRPGRRCDVADSPPTGSPAPPESPNLRMRRSAAYSCCGTDTRAQRQPKGSLSPTRSNACARTGHRLVRVRSAYHPGVIFGEHSRAPAIVAPTQWWPASPQLRPGRTLCSRQSMLRSTVQQWAGPKLGQSMFYEDDFRMLCEMCYTLVADRANFSPAAA